MTEQVIVVDGKQEVLYLFSTLSEGTNEEWGWLYKMRWNVEHSYRELKVEQGMEGGLRSRTAGGIRYEVAGHVLHYLLIRWLMVDAAKKAKVSPLRLSFKDALREVKSMSETARSQSEECYVRDS